MFGALYVLELRLYFPHLRGKPIVQILLMIYLWIACF